MQLHIKLEAIRRRCGPALSHSRFRHRIKRRVYLDQLKMLRVPTEPLPGWHFLRIPAFHKTGIRPARRADKNFPAHMSTKSRRWRKQTRLIVPVRFFDLHSSGEKSILSVRGGAAW